VQSPPLVAWIFNYFQTEESRNLDRIGNSAVRSDCDLMNLSRVLMDVFFAEFALSMVCHRILIVGLPPFVDCCEIHLKQHLDGNWRN
jgi:hypothetical protein